MSTPSPGPAPTEWTIVTPSAGPLNGCKIFDTGSVYAFKCGLTSHATATRGVPGRFTKFNSNLNDPSSSPVDWYLTITTVSTTKITGKWSNTSFLRSSETGETDSNVDTWVAQAGPGLTGEEEPIVTSA